MNKLNKKAAVIGAGPMGLACAYQLMKSGYHVTIYETDDRLGGMSASFDFDGTQIERYFHFICKTDYPFFDLLQELGIKDSLRWVDTRMGFYYQGELYEWGKPDCLLKFPHLSLISKLRYALHVMYCKSIKDWSSLDKLEATSWLKRWVGSQAFDILWKKLFSLKFYEYAETISAAWIASRVQRVGNSRKSIFQETLGYLDGGSETFLAAIKDKLLQGGAKIKLGSRVTKLLTDNGQVTGLETAEGREDYQLVCSTIPTKYITGIAVDLSSEEKTRIDAVDNIAVACVIMKLKQPVSPYFWMNITDDSMEIPGVVEYSNLNPLGDHILYVPYYMPKTNPKYSRNDELFFSEVRGCLKKLNPDFNDDWVIAERVSRYEYAQPVCIPGFFESRPAVDTSIQGFFMADTSYYYPEDRSICESVRLGKNLATISINGAP